MTQTWEHWEGVSVNGNYTLERWLGHETGAAFFESSAVADGSRIVIQLRETADGEGDAALDIWQRVRQLRHPNLIELLDCGIAEHDGAQVVYAVFEAPDDTLASALSGSELNEQESREVLDSVLDALRYLHAQGLAHGALDPDHIVAVGEHIKLTTDTLREAEPSDCREDVRLLGELWQSALLPASANSAELAAHAADPDPQTRWTLAEIRAALSPPLAVAPPPPPAVTLAPPVTVAAPAPELPAVVHEEPPPLPPPHKRVMEPASPYPFPKWIIAGVGAVLLLILALNWPRSARVATQPRDTAVALPAPAPAPVPVTSPAARAVPATKSAPPETPAAKVHKPSPTAGKEMWRVIAFTYRTREPAAKKAEQLNQYHPGLNATVFTTKDRFYLVALGGRMTHEEAVRVQRTAKGKGLPRDLYVQNYSE